MPLNSRGSDAHAWVLAARDAQQLVGADAERGGQRRDVVQRQPALAGLEPAQRRDVHPGPVRDLLERQLLLRAQLAQPAADAGVDRLVAHQAASSGAAIRVAIPSSSARPSRADIPAGSPSTPFAVTAAKPDSKIVSSTAFGSPV